MHQIQRLSEPDSLEPSPKKEAAAAGMSHADGYSSSSSPEKTDPGGATAMERDKPTSPTQM